jgi:branched-chain amino acid transport system substrate-binding protein
MKHRKALLAIIGVVAVAIVGWLIYRANVPPREEVIKIGAILPLTGNLSVIGEPERITIELFRKLNPDSKIDIRIEDSQGDPKQAVPIVNRMAHVEGIKFFIVSTSPSILSSIPIIKTINGILFAITSTPDISDGKNVFQICTNSRDEMLALAQWMKGEGIDSVAFIYPNNEFGQMIWDIFKRHYHGYITFSEAYQIGSTDFKALLTKLRDKQPRWISFQGYPNDIPVFIRQARELGIQSKFITSLATTWPSTVKNLSALDEMPVFMAPLVMLEQTRSSQASRFREEFLAHAGTSPNWDAYYVYEVLQILRNFSTVCETCGPDELRQYLLSTDHATLSGSMRIDQQGAAKVQLTPATIRNGEIVQWSVSNGH